VEILILNDFSTEKSKSLIDILKTALDLKNLFHSLGLAYKSTRGMMTNSVDRDQWLNVTSESRDRYSAFFLTVAIGNCMVKFIPPVNFCSDENIQTIFGTKLEDFLNYRTDYNSIS
jgi:hypothetical protein